MGQLVKQGYFGELYYAKARSFRRNGIPIWRGKDQLRLNFIQAGGGAFRDIGVHVLDASWWSLRTPKPVYALGAAGAKFGPRELGYNGPTPAPEIVEQFDTDDYGTGFIVFDGGASIQIESFWAAHRPNEVQIEIFGTDAGAKTSPLTIYRINNDQPRALHQRWGRNLCGLSGWPNTSSAPSWMEPLARHRSDKGWWFNR